MLNIVSIIIGAVALLFTLVAFIPFLGILNWFIIPLPIIGAVVGMVSKSNSGRNFNLFVLLICVVRLSLGGGII